jgi:hypothetical protein
MNKKSISVIVVLTFCLFLCSIRTSSAEPLGTAFTYQGRLIDANSPADGEYDFQFKIYDDESDGNQAGEDVNIPDVDVIDGYFTVELDFGNVFTGEARWLEIGVRTGDSNDVFTVLSPRQKITALPYALYVASGMEGARVEVGRFDGIIYSDMVETDPEGDTVINFESPFTTTEKPQFYVSVVLKQAADGLVEGAVIKAVETIKGSANNWTGFELDVSKYIGGSISDTTEVYVRWIAVSKTAISSTGSTETDIVTGSILYDSNPSYMAGIGLAKDVSSEITPGFTLVDVTAKGRKAHQMTGAFQDEPPLILYPKVNGTNIEILVWDAVGDEYGGANWSSMKAHIEYTLFMKKSGAYYPPHDHDERYYTKTEIDTMLADKADKTEVDKKYAVFAGNLDGTPFEASFPAEWAGFSKVEATATGYKYDTMDDSKQGPLIVIATVDTDTDKVLFEVWDTNGSEYGGSGWAGKEAHIDFVVFGTK